VPDHPARRARAAQTREALKAAARRVFARQGYLNTKIIDITREAGRAAGSFYNHFASKEELVEALIADVYPTGPAASAELRAHVATTWYLYRDHLPEISALRQAALVHEELGRRVRQLRRDRVRVVEEHLRGYRYELPGDPAVVASALVGLLDECCTAWLVAPPGQRPPDDEAIDTLTRFIRYGLGPSP
jgi:AcrR family transcriptional regulator